MTKYLLIKMVNETVQWQFQSFCFIFVTRVWIIYYCKFVLFLPSIINIGTILVIICDIFKFAFFIAKAFLQQFQMLLRCRKVPWVSNAIGRLEVTFNWFQGFKILHDLENTVTRTYNATISSNFEKPTFYRSKEFVSDVLKMSQLYHYFQQWHIVRNA